MRERDNVLHLAVAFDQNFITPFYVLLTSIFSSNGSEPLSFHVIATGISKEEEHAIISFIQRHNATVSFYEIDENVLPADLPQSNAYPLSTYYRLLFPFLVPKQVEKLLYLDTDTIVINSLRSLYQTDIGQMPVGAVIESFVSSRPELGLFEAGKYFNSGVLLMNVPQWKKQDITEKTLDYLNHKRHTIKWMDQDALNAVLTNNYFPLDLKYNVTSEYIPKKLPRRELQHFLKEKVIIHYTSGGIRKPWSGLSRNRFRSLYHYYLKKSPHSFQRKYTDFSYSMDYLLQFAKIRAHEFLIEYPSLMHLWKKAKGLKTTTKRFSKI
ncbi:MAG TPA: glycosyltransferase family 8 protein [Flavisolibacter sp.]|nr:glycosyltransferase family 8 protein [Flavisolibacter sp.]